MILSIVTVINHKEVFIKRLYKSLSDQKFEDYELKVIDNRSGRYSSLARAYNSVIGNLHGELIMFVHPDIVFLHPDALGNMIESVRMCAEKEKKAAVFGVAGACFGKDHCGVSAIRHGADKRKGGIGSFSKHCCRNVQTVDACCFFVKKQLIRKFRFWDKLNGFHLCVEELCLRVQEYGFQSVVIPADLWHVSDGRSLDSTYYREAVKVVKRHKSAEYLNTTSFHWKINWFLPVKLRFYQIRNIMHHKIVTKIKNTEETVKNAKHKIALCMKKQGQSDALTAVLEKINLVLFHWKERMRKISLGADDPQHVYYLIRPRSQEEGLLSSYYYVLANVRWAVRKGYIPVVDFRSNSCQYHADTKIRGTSNAWEYYFRQPAGIGVNEVSRKKNILLSGWSFSKAKQVQPVIRTLTTVRSAQLKDLCQNVCPVHEYVYAIAEQIFKKNFSNNTVLGVFLRGTDYTALKPKGHYRQPSVEQVIDKMKEFLSLYEVSKIFVVTEDYTIFKKIQSSFSEICVFTSDHDFVTEYQGKDYIFKSMNTDPYIRGLNYLVRIILLTKCDYLISSITNGSLFALNMMEGTYKDDYWFDLGEYE